MDLSTRSDHYEDPMNVSSHSKSETETRPESPKAHTATAISQHVTVETDLPILEALEKQQICKVKCSLSPTCNNKNTTDSGFYSVKGNNSDSDIDDNEHSVGNTSPNTASSPAVAANNISSDIHLQTSNSEPARKGSYQGSAVSIPLPDNSFPDISTDNTKIKTSKTLDFDSQLFSISPGAYSLDQIPVIYEAQKYSSSTTSIPVASSNSHSHSHQSPTSSLSSSSVSSSLPIFRSCPPFPSVPECHQEDSSYDNVSFNDNLHYPAIMEENQKVLMTEQITLINPNHNLDNNQSDAAMVFCDPDSKDEYSLVLKRSPSSKSNSPKISVPSDNAKPINFTVPSMPQDQIEKTDASLQKPSDSYKKEPENVAVQQQTPDCDTSKRPLTDNAAMPPSNSFPDSVNDNNETQSSSSFTSSPSLSHTQKSFVVVQIDQAGQVINVREKSIADNFDEKQENVHHTQSAIAGSVSNDVSKTVHTDKSTNCDDTDGSYMLQKPTSVSAMEAALLNTLAFSPSAEHSVTENKQSDQQTSLSPMFCLSTPKDLSHAMADDVFGQEIRQSSESSEFPFKSQNATNYDPNGSVKILETPPSPSSIHVKDLIRNPNVTEERLQGTVEMLKEKKSHLKRKR